MTGLASSSTPPPRSWLKNGEEGKTALLWIAMLNGSFFGADLYFSSRAKFEELHRFPDPGDGFLLPVLVPKDFSDWDYIPDNY